MYDTETALASYIYLNNVHDPGNIKGICLNTYECINTAIYMQNASQCWQSPMDITHMQCLMKIADVSRDCTATGIKHVNQTCASWLVGKAVGCKFR